MAPAQCFVFYYQDLASVMALTLWINTVCPLLDLYFCVSCDNGWLPNKDKFKFGFIPGVTVSWLLLLLCQTTYMYIQLLYVLLSSLIGNISAGVLRKQNVKIFMLSTMQRKSALHFAICVSCS